MSPPATADRTGADPLSTGYFRLDVEPDLTVGYFSEVSGLGVEWEVMEYGEGGVNDFVHKLRGRAKYPNLILKRGLTSETGLIDWFLSCRDKTERRDVTLTMYDWALNPIRTWSFAGAFPVKWTGPDFKASGSDAATETLEVAHQGLKEFT